ncbi:MAG: hypothetical protein ACI8UZ_003501, partial [Akkermansiaceae bacterium]
LNRWNILQPIVVKIADRFCLVALTPLNAMVPQHR